MGSLRSGWLRVARDERGSTLLGTEILVAFCVAHLALVIGLVVLMTAGILKFLNRRRKIWWAVLFALVFALPALPYWLFSERMTDRNISWLVIFVWGPLVSLAFLSGPIVAVFAAAKGGRWIYLEKLTGSEPSKRKRLGWIALMTVAFSAPLLIGALFYLFLWAF